MDFNDYLGKDIPKLGFGLMRLPRVEGKNGPVDMPQLIEMVDLFMEAGFTYYDTSWIYDDSEASIKQALVNRYPRASYQLASKYPAWRAESQKAAEQMIHESLERSGAEYFDYYLLHNIGGERSAAFDRYNTWEYMARCKEEGLIKHMGFSMHDNAEALDKILTQHPETEFVQLQVNYADWESPSVQSRKCYETAIKHNKPVIIMEPVKGGNLVNLPSPAADILKAAEPEASLASWALRYAGSLDGIITVLSGMSSLEQMKSNIATFSEFKALTSSERTTLAKALDEFKKLPLVPCTYCGYCRDGCPEHIAIPGIFETMNELTLYGNTEGARFSYSMETRGTNRQKASACIECGNCEEVCPQQIPIISTLKRAVEIFE